MFAFARKQYGAALATVSDDCPEKLIFAASVTQPTLQ
jgi:hypothetical protein